MSDLSIRFLCVLSAAAPARSPSSSYSMHTGNYTRHSHTRCARRRFGATALSGREGPQDDCCCMSRPPFQLPSPLPSPGPSPSHAAANKRSPYEDKLVMSKSPKSPKAAARKVKKAKANGLSVDPEAPVKPKVQVFKFTVKETTGKTGRVAVCEGARSRVLHCAQRLLC